MMKRQMIFNFRTVRMRNENIQYGIYCNIHSTKRGTNVMNCYIYESDIEYDTLCTEK